MLMLSAALHLPPLTLSIAGLALLFGRDVAWRRMKSSLWAAHQANKPRYAHRRLWSRLIQSGNLRPQGVDHLFLLRLLKLFEALGNRLNIMRFCIFATLPGNAIYFVFTLNPNTMNKLKRQTQWFESVAHCGDVCTEFLSQLFHSYLAGPKDACQNLTLLGIKLIRRFCARPQLQDVTSFSFNHHR
ncbi:MAG: hypothetical protein JWO94_1387 [Verrucomicrobiaceae bacterium]|nr:hypothetical protein [Verrucomicrobiaceae bacterium]